MPPILVERTSWKRPKPANPRYTSDLTEDEIANVKRAIRVLRSRFGSYAKLAEALRAKPATIKESVHRNGKPSVGLALRASRVAGVGIEELLSGTWPKPGSCPMCGRCG